MNGPRGVLLTALLAALLVLPVHAASVRLGRLKYSGGGDWYANPSALPNLAQALRQRTTLDVAPEVGTVSLDDRSIFDYAVVFATGHGRITFTSAEARVLREYLLHGGFLHVDDNYGMDLFFRKAVKQVFPDCSLTELPFGHPLYRSLYPFSSGLPKIHEHHGGPPRGYGILHQGRVVLFYSYNTDLNDGWESATVHDDPPAVRESALRMGINLVTYALSH